MFNSNSQITARKILLTGATGFVGKRLLECLLAQGVSVVAPVRVPGCLPSHMNLQEVAITDIATLDGQALPLNECDVVIHAAARAHVLEETQAEPIIEFRRVNCVATLSIAKLAAEAGVKRFIFISSIGVNGSANNTPFKITDTPAPTEDYALSKLEAEIGLKLIAGETGMEVVIIRPPLVYGANAPGNFGRLFTLVRMNLPLPFGAIHNKRTLVALDNLVDLLVTCIEHPAAANQTFLAGDADSLSITELLQGMARELGQPSRLVPIPIKYLEWGAGLIGRRAIVQRLCGSLQVDISHTCNTLNWGPPVSVEEGLRLAVRGSLPGQTEFMQ